MKKSLDFEKPIQELEDKIKKLRELSNNGQKNLSQEIEKIQERTDKLKLNIFKRLKIFGNKANDLKSTIDCILERNK